MNFIFLFVVFALVQTDDNNWCNTQRKSCVGHNCYGFSSELSSYLKEKWLGAMLNKYTLQVSCGNVTRLHLIYNNEEYVIDTEMETINVSKILIKNEYLFHHIIQNYLSIEIWNEIKLEMQTFIKRFGNSTISLKSYCQNKKLNETMEPQLNNLEKSYLPVKMENMEIRIRGFDLNKCDNEVIRVAYDCARSAVVLSSSIEEIVIDSKGITSKNDKFFSKHVVIETFEENLKIIFTYGAKKEVFELKGVLPSYCPENFKVVKRNDSFYAAISTGVLCLILLCIIIVLMVLPVCARKKSERLDNAEVLEDEDALSLV